MLMVGSSLVTALVAAAGFAFLDLHRFELQGKAQVSAIGKIVTGQVGPAISLGDRKAANEILASLRSDSLIQHAVLTDVRGNCFAAFHRSDGSGCDNGGYPTVAALTAGSTLSLPVESAGDRVGGLVLSASLPSMATVLSQYLGGALVIVVLSLAIAALVALALRSKYSTPILAMAEVAERISRTHRFEDRVQVASSDELGVLGASFNCMLGEIERRDSELAQHRRSLEEEIAERSRVNAELRIAKEKAEGAARMKSEFLANMSHEIRTPMNGVTGMIGLVLDRCSDSEQREQLLVAQGAAQSLITILNDILDLSKIEAARMTLEQIDFNLQQTVREAASIFESAVQEKQLELRLSFGPGPETWVRGDPVRLRQVLMNLIGNAMKFTVEGRVEVSVDTPSPGMWRFEVRDTGIGIPASKLEAIFDAFTQADGSHTRRFGGTGLGLTITRRLVDLMGGRLWAESQSGLGSRFYFDVPLAARETARQPEAAPVLPPPSLPPLHVLIAEDNRVNQKVICSMMRRQGWTYTLAESGRQAWEHFKLSRFDLILMDIQMPEMDGLEATRLIREGETRRASGHIPIVALTAHASKQQHDECLAEGMDGVVTKPVSLPVLVQQIAAVMAREPSFVRAGK
jgi:two-component system, sensor histidine kinase